MRTERWWKDYEKDYLIRRYEREIEKENMKHLRRLWWHLSDDIALVFVVLGMLLIGGLLWITLDAALNTPR